MIEGVRLPAILNFLIAGACAVVVVGGMHVTAPLLAPLLLTLTVVPATTPAPGRG